MRAPFALVLAVAALAACRQAAPTVKLELADARLLIEAADGGKHTLALSRGGDLSFDGAGFASLTTRGKILVDGKPMGNVDLDGALRVHDQLTNAEVGPDGAFSLSGAEELTLGADGVASGPLLDTIDHPKLGRDLTITYEGPPGARRAMMIGFAAFVTSLPATPLPDKTN